MWTAHNGCEQTEGDLDAAVREAVPTVEEDVETKAGMTADDRSASRSRWQQGCTGRDSQRMMNAVK